MSIRLSSDLTGRRLPCVFVTTAGAFSSLELRRPFRSRWPAVVWSLSAVAYLALTIAFAAPANGAQAVFVVYNNEILEYTTTGVLVRTLTGGPAGSFRGLAFGVDGYLYVTNTFPCNNGTGSCNELERFDPNTGAYLGAAGSITPATNPFSGVSNNAVSSNGLALGPGNDLYVTTNSLGLYQIDPVANTTVPIPTCDCGTNGVAFLPDGTPLTIGGSQNIVVNDTTGAAFNTGFFTAAQGLAFGPEGRLYVLEFHQIDTVPATGGAYTPLTVPNALSLGFFITFDAQGNTWVSDQGYGVREFSSVTGQQIGGFASDLASRFGGVALGPLIGNVWAWGDNSAGELGNGTLLESNLPLLVSSLSSVTAIAGGESVSLALKNDGSVWAWGANNFGQLGNGTGTNSTTPVQASGLSGVVAIAAGTVHSMALKNDGTVWTWGDNAFGELGDGTTNNALSPVQVSGLSSAIAVSGGQFYSLALKSDGTVWAWGFNGFGQLGNGTTTDSHTPAQVSNLTGVIAISAGYQHALALKNDGTVWTWGNNANGQLGDGTTVSELTPVRVSGLAGVVAIAGGDSYSLALKNDGTVWAWGLNNTGQLGNGSTTDSHTPVQIRGVSTIAAISAGNIFAMALRDDGTVWTWGDNSVGELGNGTLANSLTPVQASNLSGVVAISAGGPHGLAIESHAIGLAAHFTVFTPASATAGTGFNFAVTVVDASNNRVPGYIGTVHFTSTDPLAVLPSDYTFTASDYGAHTFSATTLNTAGSQTIGAADTANSAINGMSGPITINSAAATHLTVSAPASVAPGTPFSVTVSALDASGNISTGYTGTVHFSSSDPHAALPPDFTFTAADAGVHTFSATLNTPGSATIIATDTANATVSGISNAITVSSPLPPPPVQITDNEAITVTDAESFPDIFDPESVHVGDGVFVTPLIGVAAPVAEFSAGGLGFGGQSGTGTITASDIGQASLTLASAAISGGAQFSISQISCSNGATSLPTVLPSGGVCSLTITYTASTTPANDTATLVFTDNAALSNLPVLVSGSDYTQSVPLSGAGTTVGPPPPPPAVVSVIDNETVQVTDAESFADVFDREAIHVLDQVAVATLQTIAVTPANSILAKGASENFKAIATFSDGSTQDVTALATWASSNPSVVSMNGPIATGLRLGQCTVSATLGSTRGSTALAVRPPFLRITSQFVSIARQPDGSYLVTVSVTNTGDTTASRLAPIFGLLGAGRMVSAASIQGLAPGGSATLSAVFPPASGPSGTSRFLLLLGVATGLNPDGSTAAPVPWVLVKTGLTLP